MNYYANWEARISGQTVKTFLQPSLEDSGYYRKPITEKQPNGRNKVLGFIPVALFPDGDTLVGVIGAGNSMRNLTDAEIGGEELWSWICPYPIPYQWYKAVAEEGAPWPDEAEWKKAAPVLSENQLAEPEVAAPVDTRPAHEIAAEAIDMAIKASQGLKVESEADVALADGAKNRIAEARLNAKRDGEAAYKPLYAAYKKLQEAWSAPVARGEAREKEITKLITGFRERERKRIAEEAAKAAAKAAEEAAEQARRQQEIDEANERAAQRAIARGEPEPQPAFLEEEMAPAAPPAPAAAPSTPATPTYGKRTTKVELKTFAVITDPVAVFNHFIADAELLQRLNKLATDAIRRGETVPGATSREGYE